LLLVAVKSSENGRPSATIRAAKVGAVSRLGALPLAPPPRRMTSFHHLIIRSWKRGSSSMVSSSAS
jgi:hypothetical protein